MNLLESAFQNDFGFEVKQSDKSIRSDAYWFGESQSRVVVSVAPDRLKEFQSACGDHSFTVLGSVTKNTIQVDGNHWGSIDDWKNLYDTAIEKYMSVHA